MIEFVLAALALGFSAGLKPGPLGVYVIHQTLQRGYGTGLAASFAPFISDGPIIAISFLLLKQFQHTPLIMAAIAMAGTLYLLLLAWRIFNVTTPGNDDTAPSSFFTAVKINFLNPIAWMFWLTVGGFYLVTGTMQQAVAFVLVMLGTLASTKFLFAAGIRFLGQGFADRHFGSISKLLSLVLVGFAIKLCLDGLNYL